MSSATMIQSSKSSIAVRCPNPRCKAGGKVGRKFAGKRIKCPKCSTQIQIPKLNHQENAPKELVIDRPSGLPQDVVMPLGVIMACHFVNIVVGFALSSLPAIIGGVLGVLCLMIFWAILNTGYRMAWQYGRLTLAIGLFIGFFVLIGMLVALNVAVFIQAIVMWFACSLYRSLRSEEALVYFNLLCPECESKYCKPTDMLFRVAKCEHCQHEW